MKMIAASDVAVAACSSYPSQSTSSGTITLPPIVRHAADAHVPEATRSLLIEISKRYRIVGCVSGRRAVTARQIVAIGTIAYVGNHGGELLRPGATRPEVDPELAVWTARVREFAARA